MIKKSMFTAIFISILFAAPAPASEVDVTNKLNNLIAKQDEILQKLDAIQAELQVVKVRATQK